MHGTACTHCLVEIVDRVYAELTQRGADIQFKSIDLGCGKLTREVCSMEIRLTAVFQKVPEGYIGYVEELPGANTQGETLETTRENLKEAIELVLEANRQLAEENMNGEEVIREQLLLNAA